jgi:hypothetical protein
MWWNRRRPTIVEFAKELDVGERDDLLAVALRYADEKESIKTIVDWAERNHMLDDLLDAIERQTGHVRLI